jgi:hypothetical protein
MLGRVPHHGETLHKFRLLLLFLLGKTRNNNITKGSALYTAHTFDVSIYAEPLCGYTLYIIAAGILFFISESSWDGGKKLELGEIRIKRGMKFFGN